MPAALLDQLSTPARVIKREAMEFKGLSEQIEVAEIAFDDAEAEDA